MGAKLELRPYQRECVGIIDGLEGGAHLVHMATGLGKTVVFTSIARRGRVLVLSHRDELVRQPIKYYDCPVGVEKAGESSDGEDVVCATVQTLSRGKRLARFSPGEFDTIITDEAHHALAPSYRRIVDALAPRLHVGFTATPRRGDDRGLKDVFDDIVFSRDLKWGILNHWLADIDCLRVRIDWNTRQLRKRNGDYANGELDAEVNRPPTNEQIASAYEQFAQGPTIVFASSVDHAHNLSALIPDSAVVDGRMRMEERRAAVEAFRSGEIRCLLNYGVFTEGTDLPMIRTVLIARPTQNPTLYTQMVGRGLRLDAEHGKEFVRLIDCVGVTRDNRLCTAPTLFGLNEDDFPEGAEGVLAGRLSTLEERIREVEDCPRGWVLRAERYDVLDEPSGIAWVRMADGSKVVSGKGFKVVKSAPDDLGGVDVLFAGGKATRRHFGDEVAADGAVFGWLAANPRSSGQEYLWEASSVMGWGRQPASGKQLRYIEQLVGREALEEAARGREITRRDAAIIIENAKEKRAREDAERLGRCPLCGAPLKLSRSGKMAMCSSLRWREGASGLVPEGPCTFRFFLRAGSEAIAKGDVKAAAALRPFRTRGGKGPEALLAPDGRERGLYRLKPL